ncbi:MAG: hypothetical protein PHO41_01375, partial [Eubacteriales bacterium]|nr:hypothetical protein [Eubacteriales bacterium]
MRNILCLILAAVMLAASVAFGIYLGIPLTLAFLLFVYCALKNGHTKQEVAGFAKQGFKKALIVVKVLLLISLCTALFFASGSTASLIHYALLLIRPKLFLLLCFVIAAGFSMLQGSAFAAAATGGVVLYIIGCAGGVPPAMTVGAILSGVYVGDRASPVSSSLALASALTDVP